MTTKEYLERTDTAFKAGGPGGPDWNQRFLDALKENGLMLVFENPRRMDCHDYMAPIPHPEGTDQYQYPAWIVPMEP